MLEELDGTVFGTSVHSNQLKPFFSLHDPKSLDAEFLERPVDNSMDPPKQASENQQDDDEHSGDEVLGDNVQEDEADLDSSYDEDQQLIPDRQDLAVVVPRLQSD